MISKLADVCVYGTFATSTAVLCEGVLRQHLPLVATSVAKCYRLKCLFIRLVKWRKSDCAEEGDENVRARWSG